MKHKLYTQVTCPPCKIVKDYIEKESLQDKVQYVYVKDDISIEDFKSMGLRSTPTLVTTENQVIVNSANIINFLKSL